MTIIYSLEEELLGYEQTKIIKNLKDGYELLEFKKNNIDSIVSTISQRSIFGDDKPVVITNATFLTDEKLANKIQLILDSQREIYFFAQLKTKDKLIGTTKVCEIRNIAKFSSPDQQSLVNRILAENSTNFESLEAKELFFSIAVPNPYAFSNELLKLIAFNDKNPITKTSVQELVNESFDINIFKLTNYLLESNKKESIKLFENLIINKHQIIEIMQIISSQLFTIKLLKKANDAHMGFSQIESELGLSKFQIMSNSKITNKISINDIDTIMNDIYVLDYNIKYGNVNPYHGFKTILLK
jgi:DNA polymerase-3 subunit delta